MYFDFNLFLCLLGIPFLYIVLIWGFLKKDSLTFLDLLKALVLGLTSTVFLHFNYALFPPENWECLTTFEKFFYQVALREEVSKFIAFLILIKYGFKKKFRPLSIMILSGIVGMGFAIEENLMYYHRYGIDVLTSRNYTSLLGHTIFGMFTGYWYALGQIKITNSNFSKYPKTLPIIYSSIGVLSSILFHGLWNYNLTTSAWAGESIMIFMILFGLFVSFMYGKDLKNRKN
tara:strand:- start:1332 stop:2024 length:693 start_codon:yes stop_codon:yes gene_type:complete